MNIHRTLPKTVLALVVMFLLGGLSWAQDFPVLKGDYLGQTPPDSVPEIFAPGIVSVEGRYEYGLAVSPNGKEIFFTGDGPGDGLMVTRQVDGIWTRPEPANLTRRGIWEFEAFYTTDGQEVFFSAIEKDRESRIWFAEKDSSGWGKAQMLASPVNDIDVFWATFTSDGTMYYTDIKNGKIMRSRLVEGEYTETEEAGIPSGGHPFVAPDESFMLFNSKGDICISFHQEGDTWSEPQPLEGQVNSSYMETCPSLSPDGKYIFFSRYNEPEKKSNIYWVRSDVIERMGQSLQK